MTKEIEREIVSQMDKVYSGFKCSVCSKEFKKQCHLTNHLKTHNLSKEQKLEKERLRKEKIRTNVEFTENEKQRNRIAKKQKQADSALNEVIKKSNKKSMSKARN